MRVVYSEILGLHFFFQQMTLLEAQTLTLRILKQVMEEKLDQHNVQLAQVNPTPV